MTDKTKPLALVTGVGPSTGAAIVRRFAEGGYRAAMLVRDADRLATLEREVADSVALPCDVSDEGALADTLRNPENPKIVVHNAVGGASRHRRSN
jgi:NAD(P)-dependent dehydrogenase (short-subunit alcohol dehydrogenase family)